MPGIRRWMGQALDFTGRPLSARLHYGGTCAKRCCLDVKKEPKLLGDG